MEGIQIDQPLEHTPSVLELEAAIDGRPGTGFVLVLKRLGVHIRLSNSHIL